MASQINGINYKIMVSRNPTTLLTIPNDDTFDYLFKVVLIGDCGTGKTCVVQRFKTGNYVERHGNTIGVDFSMKTISIDGKKVKVCNKLYLYILNNLCEGNCESICGCNMRQVYCYYANAIDEIE